MIRKTEVKPERQESRKKMCLKIQEKVNKIQRRKETKD